MKKITAFVLVLSLLLAPAALAADAEDGSFVPSIEYRGISVETYVGDDGEEYAASIVSEDGTSFVKAGAVSVTDFGSRKDADGKISERLEKAYETISDPSSDHKLIKTLDDAARAIDPAYSAENLVACDLFDVDIGEEYAKLLDEDENALITMTFVVFGSDVDPVCVVIYEEDGVWVQAKITSVVDNGDGTLSVTAEMGCPSGPVAFLKAVETPHEPDDFHCEVFGGECLLCGIFCKDHICRCGTVSIMNAAILIVTIAAAAFLIFKRKMGRRK